MRQPTLCDATCLPMGEAMDLTVQSLRTYGASYAPWAVASSGGKDSSALLTMVLSLLAQGAIPAPASLPVLFSDTRQELWQFRHRKKKDAERNKDGQLSAHPSRKGPQAWRCGCCMGRWHVGRAGLPRQAHAARLQRPAGTGQLPRPRPTGRP